MPLDPVNTLSLPDYHALAVLVAAYPCTLSPTLTLIQCGPCNGYPGQYEANYSHGHARVTFGYYEGAWSLWAD